MFADMASLYSVVLAGRGLQPRPQCLPMTDMASLNSVGDEHRKVPAEAYIYIKSMKNTANL